jgi:hypothetical protein
MSDVEQYIEDDLSDFLGALRYDNNKTNRSQLNVFIHALFIFQQRQRERGDLWARFDEHDSFHHLRSKVARIGAMLENGAYRTDGTIRSTLNDEILDAINYSAFLWRHVNGGGWVPDVERSDI